MAALSTAANAFAVVGLADVVFKASVGLYDRLSKINNAPRDIRDLLSELKHLAKVMAAVRAYISEFRASPSATDDNRDLRQWEPVLNDCQQLLDRLKQATEGFVTTGEGWLSQLRKHTSWAFGDQKIKDLSQGLERHKMTLIMALSLTGRQNDLSFRNLLKNTRSDIGQAQSNIRTGLQAIESQISATSATTNLELRNVSDMVVSFRQHNDQSLGTVLASINTQELTLKSVANSYRLDTAKIQEHLSEASSSSTAHYKRIHAGIHQNGRRTKKGFQSVNQKLFRIQTQLGRMTESMNQGASVDLSVDSGFELFRNIDDPDVVTMPLMQLKADLAQLDIQTLGSRIPDIFFRFMEAELKGLLALSHTMSALSASGEYSHRRDSKCWKGFRQLSNPGQVLPPRYSWPWLNLRISTKSGTLWLTCWDRPTKRFQPKETNYILNIAFQPKVDSYSGGFMARFSFKQAAPELGRFFRPYSIIPIDSPAIKYAQTGNVQGLQELLNTNKVSPFDRDEDGYTLFFGADPLEYCYKSSNYVLAGAKFDLEIPFGDISQLLRLVISHSPTACASELETIMLSNFDVLSARFHETIAYLYNTGYILEPVTFKDEPFLPLYEGLFTGIDVDDLKRYVQENDVVVNSLDEDDICALGGILRCLREFFASPEGKTIRTTEPKDEAHPSEILNHGELTVVEEKLRTEGDFGQLLSDKFLRSSMEVMVCLLQNGCNPNAPHGRYGNVTNYAAQHELTWWMWTTALAEVGYEILKNDERLEGSQSKENDRGLDSDQRLEVDNQYQESNRNMRNNESFVNNNKSTRSYTVVKSASLPEERESIFSKPFLCHPLANWS